MFSMLQLPPHRSLLLCRAQDGLCRPWGLCQIPHRLGALLPTPLPTVLFSYRILEQQNFTLLKISPRQQQWEEEELSPLTFKPLSQANCAKGDMYVGS